MHVHSNYHIKVAQLKIFDDNKLYYFWCNGPTVSRSLCLQADVDTSGRIADDDALSSCSTGDDAVITGSRSSRSVVTRG